MESSMEMELEHLASLSHQQSTSANSKRFVVQDSITKVTSDGEPHGLMTMIAGLSGLLAAVIILAVLVSLVACRKRKVEDNNNEQQQSLTKSPPPASSSSLSLSLSTKGEDAAATVLAMACSMPPPRNSISSTQLAGNLNAAFTESTLTLSGARKDIDNDNKKNADDNDDYPPTTIVIERY